MQSKRKKPEVSGFPKRVRKQIADKYQNGEHFSALDFYPLCDEFNIKRSRGGAYLSFMAKSEEIVRVGKILGSKGQVCTTFRCAEKGELIDVASDEIKKQKMTGYALALQAAFDKMTHNRQVSA